MSGPQFCDFCSEPPGLSPYLEYCECCQQFLCWRCHWLPNHKGEKPPRAAPYFWMPPANFVPLQREREEIAHD